MTAVEVLTKAKHLLVTKGWTKGALAKDAEGKHANVHSSVAVCFCAQGAVMRAGGESQNLSAKFAAYDALRATNKKGFLTHYNDAPRRRKSEVLAWFDRAIKRAQKEAR